MIDMPTETFMPPAIVHVLSWQNSTVGEPYFIPKKTSQKIDVPLDNSSKEPVQVKPSADNRSAILNRLRAFRDWKRNWDGEGAAAPNSLAIDAASNFLSLWSPKKTKPEITLTHDGLPMFVISNSQLFAELIVNNDDTVDYFFEPLGAEAFGDQSVHYKSEDMLLILKNLT